MTPQLDFSDLTLISALDKRASIEPERIWSSIPKDNNDLSKGFHDITFKQFAIAANHASHWLDGVLGSGDSRITTIAYMGFNDLHPAILAVAAAKTGIKLLFPFPLAPPQAKKYLMKGARCQALLFPAPLAQPMEQLLGHESDIQKIVVPGFADWFKDEEAAHYDSEHVHVKDRPWLIFHTSGTTGLPKLVTYTQEMLSSLSLVKNAAPDDGRIASMSLFENSRMHTSIPFVHLVGLIAILTSPILTGTHMVLGPIDRPPSAETISSLIQHGNIQGLATSPVWIRSLCNTTEGLTLLKSLKYISWAGTSLDKFSGDSLCHHVQLSPSIGTTECGPYWTYVTQDPANWAYYSFIPGQGICFEPVATTIDEQGQQQDQQDHDPKRGLYELVIRKSPTAIWQQIFLLHPELEGVYRTGDVFQRHPAQNPKPTSTSSSPPDPNAPTTSPHVQDQEQEQEEKGAGLWLYIGRLTDSFKLSNGWPIHYSQRQLELESTHNICGVIKTALIGAAGQVIPFLLVESIAPTGNSNNSNSNSSTGEKDEMTMINDQIWQAVQRNNAEYSEKVAIQRDMIILADDPGRPVRRSVKDTVLRAETFALYKAEIESCFRGRGLEWID